MDRRILLMLTVAQHKMEKRANKELRKTAGVTFTQSGCLAYLFNHDGCLLTELSRGLRLNNSAITGLVDRMVRAGLVDKRNCDKDGRAFRVYMTDKGKAAATQSLALLDRFNGALNQAFSPEERQVIIRFLNFFSNVDKKDMEGGCEPELS